MGLDRGNFEMKYILKGLDCAGCAEKIEKEIRNIEGLSDVSINFVTKSLSMDQKYEEQVRDIIEKIEPDVKLISKQENKGNIDDKEQKDKGQKKMLYNILASAAFLVLGLILAPHLHGSYEFLEYTIFLISYFLAGKDVLKNAIRNIIRGDVFDENFLMMIATIGAFLIHQLPEAVGVMLFFSIGEYFEALAVNRSRKSISALVDIRPDHANLIVDGKIKKVLPEDVKIGDIILVKPGEKVPLDGVVIKGSSFVDTSALTGESVPRRIKANDEILSGMINTEGLLEIKVSKTFKDSSVSKILDLVENAASRKAQTEQFITRFAKYYTPAVVFAAIAIAIAPPLILGESFTIWIYRALTMLVISCPCALVISIPLGYFGGIGGASRQGILIKGANYLEMIADLETVVFDKTGTLTKGVFEVSEIYSENGFTKEQVLKYAALAELHSNHPIAKSIKKAYGKEIDSDVVQEYSEIAGHGVKVKVANKEILAGNEKLLRKNGIVFKDVPAKGTRVYVAIDNKYAGQIIISDKIREDAKKAIKEIKSLGVKRTVMLTGDEKNIAQEVANFLGIDEYYAELLPEDKVKKIEEIQRQRSNKGKVAFVGDGINDAPVITRADVGFAMGGLGSDAAIEAADVVIMEDMPSKIAEAIKIARHTRKIIIQNIIFALGIKGVFLTLGAIGIATMWQAVFADVGVAILAVLNSTRALHYK